MIDSSIHNFPADAVPYPHEAIPATTQIDVFESLATSAVDALLTSPVTTTPPSEYWLELQRRNVAPEEILANLNLGIPTAKPGARGLKPCKDEKCGKDWVRYDRAGICVCLNSAGMRSTKLFEVD